MAPGAKFSTMTSARFTMFLTRSSPRSDLRLTVMDFLLALNNRKYQESRFWLWLGPDCRPNKERPASPPCGFSTLTTSAPIQARASVHDGPASNWVRSRIFIPLRQLSPLMGERSFDRVSRPPLMVACGRGRGQAGAIRHSGSRPSLKSEGTNVYGS